MMKQRRADDLKPTGSQDFSFDIGSSLRGGALARRSKPVAGDKRRPLVTNIGFDQDNVRAASGCAPR